jgi:hypothetical protein
MKHLRTPCIRSRNQQRDASGRHDRRQKQCLPTMRLIPIIVHDWRSRCSDARYFSFSHRRLFPTTLHLACQCRLVRAYLVGCPHDNSARRHSPHFCYPRSALGLNEPRRHPDNRLLRRTRSNSVFQITEICLCIPNVLPPQHWRFQVTRCTRS